MCRLFSTETERRVQTRLLIGCSAIALGLFYFMQSESIQESAPKSALTGLALISILLYTTVSALTAAVRPANQDQDIEAPTPNT